MLFLKRDSFGRGQDEKIETVLSNPGENDDVMELTRTYLEHKRDLDAWTEEWAELSEKSNKDVCT